jgi:N-acetylglucosamine-6-phosphate deacetylase
MTSQSHATGGAGAAGSLALVADRVFDGARVRPRCAVLIENGRIARLASPGEAAGAARIVELPEGSLLAPGFIDTQVNGGGGVLLNDEPTIGGLRTIAETHRRYGTTGLLPTLISDRRAVMRRAIDAVAEAIEAGIPGVVGIHLEGPFLNPARKGAHPLEHLVAFEDGDIDLLSSLGGRGVTLVTLAPERVPKGVVRALTERGVRVCAGHTEATAEQIAEAVDEGLAGFTHLFNAMSQLGSRAPGTVGAALTEDRTVAGVIPDGFHVAERPLQIAYRAKGPDGLMIVTDAMPPVGTAMDRFRLFDTTVLVGEGRCTFADGTLAGALLDMAAAVRHMVERIGVPLEHALAMASRTPAAFLGLEADRGTLAPGSRADLVALDPDLRVVATLIGGEAAPARE